MRKTIIYLSLFFLIFLNYGCPVGLDYALGNPGKEKINPAILGTWVTDNDEAEVLSVTFSKLDDFSYKVTVNERGTMYALETDNLTAWITKFEGKEFLYLKPDDEDKYYHYMLIKLDEKTLISTDLSLLDGGIDAVKSTESLRKEVKNSINKPEFGKEKIEWFKE